MPPNEGKIMEALQARGLIPAGADPDQAESILHNYLNVKLNGKGKYVSSVDKPSPKGAKEVGQMEKAFRGGNTPGSQPIPLSKKTGVGKILVLLIEFAQAPGPMHGNLPQPADPTKDYWAPSFERDHYVDTLFNRNNPDSLASYYIKQSDGVFTVDGGVYGWVQLPHDEAYYGADDPNGGTDDLNGPVWRVVKDAVDAAAAAGLNIPYRDFDADGDGYVDSLMLVHAGAGQEGGGGAQGDDSIWSHSWFVDYAHYGYRTADGTWVGSYTIEPEDGATGVFAHEYGHQLGLPDLYDTIYSGESSTGFWTLMSSGSWCGVPLGAQPSDLDIWSKMVLGWTPDLKEVDKGAGQRSFHIRNTEINGSFAKGFRVNLPAHPVTLSVVAPYEGQFEFWSQMGDDLNNTMTRAFDLSGVTSATLNFKTWYDIEKDYDYGYVEVSKDNGASWNFVAGSITTVTEGIPGITGTSGGWVDASYDLSAYAGRPIQLRFRYYTDPGVAQKGWVIDNVSLPELGYFDGAETGAPGWTFNGFQVFAGSSTTMKAHYYIGELRNFVGFDNSLKYVYNYFKTVYPNDSFERFSYGPGVLLWYRDTAFVDNWVGLHPGQGRLLMVDSHWKHVRGVDGRPLRTRIQVFDAAFGLANTPALTIHDRSGRLTTVAPQPGVGAFDDSLPWWESPGRFTTSDTSVIVPAGYGVKVYVDGISDDGSGAKITVDFK
jgi:immune inhibitor A